LTKGGLVERKVRPHGRGQVRHVRNLQHAKNDGLDIRPIVRRALQKTPGNFFVLEEHDGNHKVLCHLYNCLHTRLQRRTGLSVHSGPKGQNPVQVVAHLALVHVKRVAAKELVEQSSLAWRENNRHYLLRVSLYSIYAENLCCFQVNDEAPPERQG